MIRLLSLGAVCAVLLLLPNGSAQAQDVYAYPKEGQSKEQQEKDEFECYRWAREQSGVDPAQAQQSSSPPPRERSTGPGVLGGAAIGAGGGALIGAATGGSAGKGAAFGAIGGGLIGGVHSERQKSKNKKDREEWERQQAANQQGARNSYNRAYAACMQSRGYTVN